MTPRYDVAVVGGGIVGLATAWELLNRWPGRTVAVLEKESSVAAHQTSHNSGVIHSGLYYAPGSLKARACVEGARLMVEFCRLHQVPHEICGKVVVATEPAELPALQELHRRGVANGVPGLALIGPERLRELEPHARGISALHVPGAGIVDYAAVAGALSGLIERAGGVIRTSTKVERLSRNGSWTLETLTGALQAEFLVTCGGLQEDRLVAQTSRRRDLRILPFRGDYYTLAPARRGLVRAMIYPVPNPLFPFLGVHFTRAIDESVHVGPNAVLALKREGYGKADVSLQDALAMLGYPGFWRMAWKYWPTGLEELRRSWSRRAFVRAAQRLVPEVQADDLVAAGSGVRAQAVDRRGMLVNDFDLLQEPGAVHVRNVPSPAATASLRVAQFIADRISAQLTAPTPA